MKNRYLSVDAVHVVIGQNIKKQRKLKGISQLKLALSLGYNSVSLISMAKVSANNKHFNIEYLAKIYLVLDVSIKVFFEGVDEVIHKKIK